MLEAAVPLSARGMTASEQLTAHEVASLQDAETSSNRAKSAPTCCMLGCMQVSFVEIYNESIQDLLNPQQQPGTSSSNLLALRLNNLNNQGNNGSSNNNGSSTPRSVSSSEGAGSSIFASSVASDGGGGSSSGGAINIRETSKGEIVLEGISEVLVHTMDELAVLLEQGNAVRATAAHKLNQHSSRSHAILTLTLEQRARPSAAKQLPAECRYLRSKLHLGDLAGSERAKETGTTGALTYITSRSHIILLTSSYLSIYMHHLCGWQAHECMAPKPSQTAVMTACTVWCAYLLMSLCCSVQTSAFKPSTLATLAFSIAFDSGPQLSDH